MKHVPFTAEIGLKTVEKLQKAYKKDSHAVGVSVFGEEIHSEPCYAPTAGRLQTVNYDHFGLLYQGWSGKVCTQELGPEAELWLEYLLDPEGAFKAILPYLWHTSPKEIIEDKGFVFKDLAHPKTPVNVGLLWVFAQATRYFFENPTRMERFLYLAKLLPNDKTMVLFTTLCLQPVGTISNDVQWALTVDAHGEPLGYPCNIPKRAGAFLNGVLTPVAKNHPSGSSGCFGGYMEVFYVRQSTVKLLDEWLALFEKERTQGERSSKAA